MNRLKKNEIDFMIPENSIESDRLVEYKSDRFFLIPTQPNPNPREGEIYYDKDDRKLKIFTGSEYEEITSVVV